MQMSRTLLWGIAIYAVMFLAANFVHMHADWFIGWDRIFMLGTLVITLAYATDALKARTLHDAIPHALAWTLVAMALDASFVLPQSDIATLYGNSDTWVGYILLATLPLLFVHHRARHD